MNKEEMIKGVEDRIRSCKLCSLSKTRKFAVVGEGNINAKIMFIGEAPGEEEDKSGIPFVGEAGQILNMLFATIGLNRKDIYIANVLKCRPLHNSNPKDDEIKLCTPYLEAQIEIIKPEVIVTLGKFATEFIMNKYGLGKDFTSITNVKGKIFNAKDIKIIPLFHPAVAIYEPSKSNMLKQDIKILGEFIK